MKNLVSHGNVSSRDGNFAEAVRANNVHKGRLDRYKAYRRRVRRNRRHIKNLEAMAGVVELHFDN